MREGRLYQRSIIWRLLKVSGSKPKKYSINAKDEINAAVREVQKGLDKRAILEVTKKAREMGLSGSTPTEAEIMDMLTPEQLSALIDSSNVASSKVMEVASEWN